MEQENQKIKVIDSLMGTGKTSWAIQFMNEADADSDKFIYITPFLNEVERVKKSVNNREFVQPETSRKKNKQEHLKELVAEGKDIVSTHALFKKADDALIELIEMENYTLILDEVMNVIEQESVTAHDLKYLTDPNYDGEPLLFVKPDGFAVWTDKSYDGKFNSIKSLAESGNLMVYKDEEEKLKAIYWTFPVGAFKAFDQVLVLTYMFDGQMQKYYYDMFNIDYYYKSVRFDEAEKKYKFIDFIPFEMEDRSHLKELINIHYSKLNDVGKKENAFSSTQLNRWANNEKYAQAKKKVKNNAYNFYRNKMKVPTEEVMWTTIKGDKDKNKKALAPQGLAKEPKIITEDNKKKQKFVEVNARATNDFQHKSTCIYLANRYMNPMLKGFLEKKGGQAVNEDKFALSEMLQWLFRSRIRNNQPIDVYIPSKRMRRLLEQYLNNEL